MFSIVRVIFRWIVYLLLAIIPIVCGFFGGMFREIIATGDNWNEIQKLIAGGYFGLLIKCIIWIFVAILVARLLLSIFVGYGSSGIKDFFIENIISEKAGPAWILSVIIGLVIGLAIVGIKLLISIIIGFIVGIIIDAIIFGMIVTILNIDENLEIMKIKYTTLSVENIKSADADDMKKCPFCAEQIKREAKICRFCNREVRTKI